MATLVFSAIGNVIAGPTGGSIGALIGQQVDRAIFSGGSREGPRLKELSVTTSSYGQPLARHFGRMRVPGTVIWSTELIETSKKEGGGKGQPSTKTYSYSASFAVALSSTEIDRIGRIWADGNLLRGEGGDLKVEGEMRTYLGTGDNPVDPLIEAERGGSAPAFRDCAYIVFEDLQLGEFGNRIPALTFEIFAPFDETVSLSQLVPQSVSREGDTTLQDARGFSDEGGPIGSTLSAIDRIYPLTCTTHSDGLNLTSTSKLPSEIPTLPEQLSERDSDEAEQRTKQRGESIGREPLALRYYDENRDYQPSVQRAIGVRPNGREIMLDLPATMTASGARNLANANTHRSRFRHERVVWKIGEIDSRIGPGSIVRLPHSLGFWSVRSWEWFDRGVELELERFAPEIGAIAASDGGASNRPIDQVSPPSFLHVFEAPPDSATPPSIPVILAAVTSTTAGWKGATLFVESAGSVLEIGSSGSERALVGGLVDPLEPSSNFMLDATASIQIDLVAEDLTFQSTDVTGLAMGNNRLLVGGEVIQFHSAERIGETRWELSGLLRGRAGTEDKASFVHNAGTTAVLLDERITTLDPSLGSSSTALRIAALGQGDSEPFYAELQNVGLSRRPPMPVSPRNRTLADSSSEYCWTRRARGQWRWSESTEVPLVEEQELYTIGLGPVDSPLIAWSSSDPVFVLSLSEKATLLSEYGSQELWVKQVGTYGQSPPLLLANI